MIEKDGRHTKVIKSFEGAALNADEARQVAGEEVDVLRLVWHARTQARLLDFMTVVRQKRAASGRRQPVMVDVSSVPQAVVEEPVKPMDLAFGETVTMSQTGGRGVIRVRTETWQSLFKMDARVYLGPGNAVLKVKKIGPELVDLEVIQGGTVFPEIDVNVPDTRAGSPNLDVTVKQLKPVLDAEADFLVIPSQWQTARIRQFRAEIRDLYGEAAPWLIVKIDSLAAVERLGEIVEEVEGVLISRREMSRTTNPATVPMITKEIIQLCNDRAKVVVTASEMLASMRRNATPTRAEVSDVANAVLDGTDAVVISEEVTSGSYGPQAVQTMHNIIRDIEERTTVAPNWTKAAPTVANEMDAIAYQAFKTAERVKAKAIVCITKAGNTALKLASFQPPVPVIAVTFSEPVVRRLAVVRGVEPLLLGIDPNLEEVLPTVNDQLIRYSWLKAGDPIIFVAITLSPVGRESSNLFTVQFLS